MVGERVIGLTQGFEARVSACDFDRVSKHKWCVHDAKYAEKGYPAYARGYIDGKRVHLHRFILGAKPGEIVDHIDGDGLNCTRSNLRFTDRSGNRRNGKKPKGTKCRFKGVSKVSKISEIWRCEIKCKDIGHKHLGCFGDEIAAALAYDEAALKYYGAFARPNFDGVLTVEEMRLKINSIRDRMFSVEVIRKSDGKLRTMTCRMGVRKHGHKGIGPRCSRKAKGLCCVYDVAKDVFRMINVSGVRVLTVNKEMYTLRRWADENPRRQRRKRDKK